MARETNVGPLVAAIFAIAIGSGLAGSGKKRRRRGGALPPEMPEPLSGGQADIRYLAEWAFLDEEWAIFLEATAAGESGFDNLRGLGNPALFPEWASPNMSASQEKKDIEANAARRAYDRNTYLHDCPWPAARYSFGSGGWFGLLPANAVFAFKGTRYECIDPWSVFDPVPSLVEIIEYCRRTMRRDSFKANPTWLNLRVGIGNPSNMNKADQLARVGEKFREKLLELGYPESFMYREVTPLPQDNPADLLDALMEVL